MCARGDGRIERRAMIRLASTGVFMICAKVARADLAAPRTVVNGVLSAYGLPTIREAVGYQTVVQQYGDSVVVTFQCPKSWVVRRALDGNAAQLGRASGLTAGDYRRSEGVALYVTDRQADVVELVTPGDAVRGDGEAMVVRDTYEDGDVRMIETKFESTTRSGYVIQRRALTCAVVAPDRRLYALSASCSDARWRKMQPVLHSIVDSFQVFRI